MDENAATVQKEQQAARQALDAECMKLDEYAAAAKKELHGLREAPKAKQARLANAIPVVQYAQEAARAVLDAE